MPLNGPNPASPDDWVKLAHGPERQPAIRAAWRRRSRARTSTSSAADTVPAVDFVVRRGHDEIRRLAQWHEHRRHLQQQLRTPSTACQVTVPIFAGGLTNSRVRQAQYRHTAARERLERTARATERSTRDAFLGVNSEVARVQSLKQAVDSAQTALQATKRATRSGRARPSTSCRPGSACSSPRPTMRAAATTTC